MQALFCSGTFNLYVYAGLLPAFSMHKDFSFSPWLHTERLGPLGLVLLLHVGVFYALQSGLNYQAPEPIHKEVFVTLITPQPAPQPPQPQPPKAEPPKPQPAPPKPAKPVAPRPDPTPAPKAITTPPQPEPAPVPTEPAVAATPAAPASPPAAPAPAAPAQPKTITSGIEYLQPPQPEYPMLSKRMGEEGTVMLRITVNERGRVERVDIHKSSGIARLDESARQAALRAVFKPYLENGRAIPVYAILPIKFQLDN